MFPVSLTKVPVVPRARNELGFLLIQGIPNTCKLPGAELRTCKACWLGLLLAGQSPSSLEAPKDALRLSKVGGPLWPPSFAGIGLSRAREHVPQGKPKWT